MLRLINIRKNDEFIEAGYVPENSNEVGYLKLKLSDKSCVESKITSYDKMGPTYLFKAQDVLGELADSATPLPKERLVMWY